MATGAAVIGTLGAIIGLDTKPLLDGANKANAALGGLDKSLTSTVNTAAKVGAAAVAAGIGIVTGLVVSGLDAINTQASLARSIGGTVTGLRTLTGVAEDFGSSQEEVASSMAAFNRQLGEAQRAGTPAAKTFEQLGLNAAELAGMDVDKRVEVLADRIKELGLSSSQTAAVTRDLGIRSAEFVDILRQGGDVIRDQRDEVTGLGQDISEIDVAMVVQAKQAMGDFADVLATIRDKVVIAMAPFISELSARFKALAIDNKGFGDQASASIETLIRWFAKLADVVQGLRVVIKGAELIGVGFGAAMLSAVELAITGFTKLDNVVREVVNKTISYLNELPGVEITPLDLHDQNTGFLGALHDMGEAARNQVGVVRDELHALAMQEMPSGKVEEFFESVRKRAKEAAQAAVEARGAMTGAGPEGFGEDTSAADEKARKEKEALNEKLDAELERLREHVASESELENMRHEERLKKLAEALEAERILKDDAAALELELEQEHVDELERIRVNGLSAIEKELEDVIKKGGAAKAKFTAKYLADISASTATHSKTMFEINKAAAIAGAVMDSKEAIVGAYKVGAKIGGPVLGGTFAAAAALATLAQINAIRSQSFEGGGAGAAPSLAGSTPAPPVSPVGGGGEGGGGRQVISVEGVNPDSMFTGRQLRNLWENLMGVVEDGNRSGRRVDVVFA